MRVAVLVAALAIAPLRAGASFWVQANNGMSAWSFNDVAIDPGNPLIVYATGTSGVFKSTNGGASWTAVNNGLAPTPYTLDIEIDPSNSNVLYIASQFPEGGRGVWKSTDGGASWVRKSSGINYPYVNSVSAFRANPQILCAGTVVGGAPGGVYRSTNGGDSWTLVAGTDVPGSGIDNDAAPIVVDPADSNYVFCGRTYYTGFMRSTDGGSHFTWTDNSFNVKYIAINPADTNRILAGGDGWLKISHNRGQSLADTGIHYTNGGIAIAPSNPEIVYAGPMGQPVYRSTDRGDNWAAVGSEGHNWAALAVHPTDPNTIYAATNGEGMLKSTNGGLNWTPINGGLPSTMRCTKMVTSLKYRTTWAILDNRAIYASYDDGAYWNQLAAVTWYPGDLEIWGGDDKTLYMANGDIYRSTDLGFTWIGMNAAPTGHSLCQIAVDPQNANRMFVGDDTDRSIRRSTDGGASWQTVFYVPGAPQWGNNNIWDIEIDPTNSQRIYLGTYNHPWRSDSGGDTWSMLSGVEYDVWYGGELKKTSFIRDIAIDPVQRNVIYAMTQWGGSWKSTDYGNTWTRLWLPGDDGFVHNNLVFDPRDHDTIYVSTMYHGVYRSTNGGGAWTQLIDGLGSDLSVQRIALSGWNYDHIFGGTIANGVWRGGGGPDIPTLDSAKGLLPDGGIFAFSTPQVVSGAMPDGAIYVQAQDRSSGIRVVNASGFEPGDLLSLKGSMGTSSGERYLSAMQAAKVGATDPPKPLGAINRAIGGAGYGPEYPAIEGAVGLCNTGLLVRTWGKVTSVLDCTRFYISDGSSDATGTPTPVLVASPAPVAPAVGDWVEATGESGATVMGSIQRCVRARSAADIDLGNLLANPGFETGDTTGWTYIQQGGGIVQSPWSLGGISSHCGSYFWGVATDGGATPASIYQRVRVEPGQSYLARAASLIYRGSNTTNDVKNRVGIDRTGGTSKYGADVVWSAWDTQPTQWLGAWHLIQTPTVTPTGEYATVFLDTYQASSGWHINCFDDTALLRR